MCQAHQLECQPRWRQLRLRPLRALARRPRQWHREEVGVEEAGQGEEALWRALLPAQQAAHTEIKI